MKNRKLTRIIAITLTATVAATSVMPCGTVLGAQNDPVTEEAAETTESVQESEVSESEISEDEIQTETESQTGTEAGTEKEINTEINTETGTETEIGMETENDAEIETEIETEQIELESSDFLQIGSKVIKNTVDCETKEKRAQTGNWSGVMNLMKIR